jgi:predicted DCC family thiol-disulfide oxidoreductase YuxK
MVYDGYCNVCSGWARFMARHPISPPFTLVGLYRWLARNRYRWFGKRTVCYLPGMKD